MGFLDSVTRPLTIRKSKHMALRVFKKIKRRLAGRAEQSSEKPSFQDTNTSEECVVKVEGAINAELPAVDFPPLSPTLTS